MSRRKQPFDREAARKTMTFRTPKNPIKCRKPAAWSSRKGVIEKFAGSTAETGCAFASQADIYPSTCEPEMNTIPLGSTRVQSDGTASGNGSYCETVTRP